MRNSHAVPERVLEQTSGKIYSQTGQSGIGVGCPGMEAPIPIKRCVGVALRDMVQHWSLSGWIDSWTW